jgi:DNA primase
MFPLADVRGRVLGFGARAMRDEQKPKYLNTSDNDVYHKGLHLYGADLARAHATRAGEVIVCEGYTDVIALHQAGMRGAVGLMGTALTTDQVGELARMAQTVLLALDADSAGQEAMLKASSLAAKRKLELRVVPLAAGADPAEMIQREGPEAIREAVKRSVAFVRFRVERVLASGDDSSPEGRDRMIEELRPVFATLPPSAMRMELMRIVSGRLALPERLAETLLAGGGAAAGSGGQRSASARGGGGEGGEGRSEGGRPVSARVQRPDEMTRREDTERAFLALCIASPQEGAQALAGLELEEHFSSALLRRAAKRLRDGDLRAPMGDVPESEERLDEDPQLKGLLAELVVEAGRDQADAGMLDVQRLQLELARVDRQIQRARGQEGGDISALAQHKAEVKREFDRAYGRVLEETGERA